LQNSTKCHFNRPGKTRIRSVKGILALFCYILTFGLFQFMIVSTTRPILSMSILIYSFSDTYYVWVACDFSHVCLIRQDGIENRDKAIPFSTQHKLSL